MGVMNVLNLVLLHSIMLLCRWSLQYEVVAMVDRERESGPVPLNGIVIDKDVHAEWSLESRKLAILV